MPNWCTSNVTITAEPATITEILEKIGDTQDFTVFAPDPDDDNIDWYSWRIKNWGTKWVPEVYGLDNTDTQISLSFQSAWSPPLPLLQTISDKAQCEVLIDYYEIGMDFVGAALIVNGTVVDEVGGIISETIDFDDHDEDYTPLVEELSQSYRDKLA